MQRIIRMTAACILEIPWACHFVSIWPLRITAALRNICILSTISFRRILPCLVKATAHFTWQNRPNVLDPFILVDLPAEFSMRMGEKRTEYERWWSRPNKVWVKDLDGTSPVVTFVAAFRSGDLVSTSLGRRCTAAETGTRILHYVLTQCR